MKVSNDPNQVGDVRECLENTLVRLTDLEIRITHQTDLIEQLNEVIYAQQKKIDLLETKVASLEKQILDPAPANEPPPHY